MIAALVALPATAALPQAEPPPLALQETIVRHPPAGGELVFRIDAAPGDFLAVVLQQFEVDVEAQLEDGTGSILAHADCPWEKQGPELLAAIAVDGGPLLLRIRVLGEGRDGAVRVLLRQRRPATAADRELVAALARLDEANGDVTDPAVLRRDVEVLERIAAVARSAGNPLLEGLALSVAARNWTRLDDRDRAMAAYDESRPAWGPLGEPWLRAWRHVMVGSDQYRQREHAAALQSFTAAKELWQEIGDRRGVAIALGQMADCRQWLGNQSLGVEEATEAARLWEELGEVHNEALALETAANYRRVLGDLDGALAEYARALRLARSADLGSLQAEISSLTGLTHRTAGNYQRALDSFRQALPLMEASGDHQGIGMVQVHLGTTYYNLGDTARARAAFERAVTEFESAGDSLEIGLSRLGGVLIDLDETEARRTLDRALTLARDHRVRWIEGMILAQIARLDSQLGRHEQAIAGYRTAVEIARSIDDAPRLASGVLGLAASLRAAGDLDGALATYLEAAEIGDRLGTRELLGSAFLGIARIERERHHLDEALAKVRQAVAIFESIRDTAPGSELRSLYLARHRDAYELYVDLLLDIDQRTPNQGMLGAAFEASDRAHARGLLELLAQARIDPWAGVPADLRAREDQAQRAIARVQTVLIRERSVPAPEAARLDRLESELAARTADLESVRLDIELQRDTSSAHGILDTVTAADVQQWLADGTVLLEYLTGRHGSHLFVLGRTGAAAFALPAEERIAELVRAVREGIERPGRLGLSRYREAAQRLYAAILGPAAPLLGGASRLVIVPDGPLHLLPFEVLLTERTETGADSSRWPYLARTHEIAYVPSANILLRLERDRRHEGLGLLAFGDAIYDPIAAKEKGTEAVPSPRSDAELITRGTYGSWPLPRLPGSAVEVRSIAELFGPTRRTVLVRESATEEAAKKLLQQRSSYDVVHFASHALVSDTEPQHSGIVLSLDDDPTEDGLLQTYEILRLHLASQLVVLSACNTGLGPEIRGEGLLGLTRSFLHAGARSTLVSLWRVPDQATEELMTAFYRHLTAGSDAGEALRRARLSLIESSRYSHPHYWAAFVLWGAPDVSVRSGLEPVTRPH